MTEKDKQSDKDLQQKALNQSPIEDLNAADKSLSEALRISFIILKVVDAVIGLRVSEEQEQLGLDLSLHDEQGYNLN